LPLLNSDQEVAIAIATEALGAFSTQFEHYWLAGMRKKLGLTTGEAGDLDLIRSLLTWMQESRADFTNTFRDLASEALPAGEKYQAPEFQAWYSRWQLRLSRAAQSDAPAGAVMQAANPAVIPRNHRVEEALSAAEEQDDLSVLHRLLAALASPYETKADLAMYREPPADDAHYRTFCGT
jgi:serine/tyrosine/threonine adenylyltransferase